MTIGFQFGAGALSSLNEALANARKQIAADPVDAVE